LVLDDIVSTIDSSHRNRIIELIFENFPEKQIIITTHDQIWYDQIINTQKMFNIRNSFRNYTISKWNIKSGVDLIPYKKKTEVIENKLDSMDKSGSGNEIRQYLEYILSNACEKLIAKIPFKMNGRYTLNDYFENFGIRINQIKLNRDVEWKKNVLKVYDELDKYRTIINSLSHFNDLATNISIDEIRDVFVKSEELNKLLTCGTCEYMLEYDYSSKLIMCVNQKCKNKTIYQ
jgi:hypothetical protein